MKKRLFVFVSILLVLGGIVWIKAEVKTNQKSKMEVVYLTQKDFQTKIYNYTESPTQWKYLGNRPAIIDFYATWCGPCKRLSPLLEKLANDFPDIAFYKVDIDKENELADRFGVQAVPTLLFIPLEELPQKTEGLLPEENLKEVINSFLLKK